MFCQTLEDSLVEKDVLSKKTTHIEFYIHNTLFPKDITLKQFLKENDFIDIDKKGEIAIDLK